MALYKAPQTPVPDGALVFESIPEQDMAGDSDDVDDLGFPEFSRLATTAITTVTMATKAAGENHL